MTELVGTSSIGFLVTWLNRKDTPLVFLVKLKQGQLTLLCVDTLSTFLLLLFLSLKIKESARLRFDMNQIKTSKAHIIYNAFCTNVTIGTF